MLHYTCNASTYSLMFQLTTICAKSVISSHNNHKITDKQCNPYFHFQLYFSTLKKYAEFKNQSLMKSAGTETGYILRNTPGVTHITNSPEMRVFNTPASNLTYLAPLGQFLMGAKLFPGNRKGKKCCKN